MMEEMEGAMAHAKIHMKARRKAPTEVSRRSKKIFVTFKKNPKKIWAFLAGGALVVLLLITLGLFLYNAKMSASRIIAKHVDEMGQIFNAINEKCGIIGFEHDANYVDFLNVGSFVGSEVGAMNLRDAKNWEGPYMQDNPTVQTKYYEIIKTKKGYFLVPGKDVKLSSGLVIGSDDLAFDKDTDIAALIENGTLVNKDGKPLAVAIPIAH